MSFPTLCTTLTFLTFKAVGLLCVSLEPPPQPMGRPVHLPDARAVLERVVSASCSTRQWNMALEIPQWRFRPSQWSSRANGVPIILPRVEGLYFFPGTSSRSQISHPWQGPVLLASQVPEVCRSNHHLVIRGICSTIPLCISFYIRRAATRLTCWSRASRARTSMLRLWETLSRGRLARGRTIYRLDPNEGRKVNRVSRTQNSTYCALFFGALCP